VAWCTVHRILVAEAAQALGQAAPTTMIGVDKTPARSVRWSFKEDRLAQRPVDDLDPRPGPNAHEGDHRARSGRSGACVEGWMSLQSTEFRDGVAVVAIDPSAP
jgi:hypothetical protein